MVYKRYIKKDGKVYGPYSYSNHKEKGKVVTEYIGKESSVKEKKNNSSTVISFLVIIFLVLSLFVGFFYFKHTISGFAIGDIEQKFLDGKTGFDLDDAKYIEGKTKDKQAILKLRVIEQEGFENYINYTIKKINETRFEIRYKLNETLLKEINDCPETGKTKDDKCLDKLVEKYIKDEKNKTKIDSFKNSANNINNYSINASSKTKINDKVDLSKDGVFNVDLPNYDKKNFSSFTGERIKVGYNTIIFEFYIEITSAVHLNSSREFISDIYDSVKANDSIWSETIKQNEYVRVTFENNLTNENDITIYARGNNSIIEVYEKDGTNLIATFPVINSENWSKIYLTNLTNPQDTFDLKVSADTEFDYIIDPTYSVSQAEPVALAPLSDNMFVVGWCDESVVDIFIKIYDTNGTNITGDITVDNSVYACDFNQLSISPFNSTTFVIGYADNDLEDATFKIYDSAGNNLTDQISADIAISFNSVVSVSALNSTAFAMGWWDKADGDATFAIYDSAGNLLAGPTDADTNVVASQSVSVSAFNSSAFVFSWFNGSNINIQIIDSAGNNLTGIIDAVNVGANSYTVTTSTFNSTTFVLGWHDFTNDDITFKIFNSAGNNLTGDIDASDNVFTSYSASVSALNSTAFVISWYDDVEFDKTFSVYTSNGTLLAGPIDSNINITDNIYWQAVSSYVSSTNVGICNQNFIHAFPVNATGADWIAYNSNGSIWNGVCGALSDTPPVSILSRPANNNVTDLGVVNFECNATNNNLANVTLYVWNSSGGIITTNSTNLTGTTNSTIFSYNFTFYNSTKWNCLVYDNASQSSWASTNRSLNISAPIIYSLQITSPTATSPLLVNSGDNISVYFNFLQDATNITSGVTLNNLTIGGIQAPIIIVLPYTQDFEDATFPPAGWLTGGDANWYRNTTEPDFGTASAASGDILDSQKTWINYTYNFVNTGNVSFFWNVSSETGFDFACFCVDKICGDASCSCSDTLGTADLRLSSSSNGVWTAQNASYYVNTTGNHNLTWCYAKDASASQGADMVKLDNIIILNQTSSPTQFVYVEGKGWEANVTIPTGLTGLQDLFVNATYSIYERTDTETGAINYSIPDTIYPQFSNYYDNNASFVDSGIGLFNVTVENTNGTVWLEINNTNITATNLTSNVYNVSYNFSAGGTYTYRWHSWGNGTNNKYNTSGARSYTVNTSVVTDTTAPNINFTNPTPSNGTTQTGNSIFVNVSTTDANNHSTFIDFNRSLIGWWSFDSYNDTGIYDNSTYGNFGTFQAVNISNILSGMRGNGMQFNGINNYVNIPDSSLSGFNTGLTVSLWIKSTVDNDVPISDFSSQAGGYGIYTDNNWYTANGSSFLSVSAGRLTDNNWHMYTFIWNITNLTSYRDGNLLAVADGLGALFPSSSLSLGRDNRGGNNFNGSLDEVIIFNRALSNQEILALYNASTYQYYNNFTNLPNADYNFTAYAIDSSGNVNKTETRIVTIGTTTDTTAPYFTSIPANASIIYNTQLDVDFNASDETAFGTYAVNDTRFTINSSGGLKNNTVLGVAVYIINVSITDTGGNYNSTLYRVNVTRANLSGDLVNNTALTLTYPTPFNFSISESNTGDGDVVYKVFRNGDDVSSENNSNIVLGVGSYNFTLNSTGGQNYSANSSIENFTLTVSQNTSAVIYTYLNNSRQNITIYNNTAIWLNSTLFNVTGTIYLYKNGTLINSGNSPLSNLTNFNGTGIYNITSIYPANTNYSGSSETWWVNVTPVVDSTFPQISITTPTNGTNSTNTGLDVNYTASDETALSSCWYSNDSYSVNTTLSNCSTNITSIIWSEGFHNVTIWTNDSSNNLNSSSVSFRIDTLPPYFTNLANQTVTVAQSLNYDINAADNGVGVGSFAINWTNTFAIVASTGILTNSSALAIGLYEINVSVNDTLGNLNSSILLVNVTAVSDITNPLISIISPSNSTYSTTTISFNISSNENLSYCKFTINNWVTNYTMTLNASLTGANYTNSTMGQGSYAAKFWCNDTSNNVNDSEDVSFLIDSVYPEINMSYPQNTSYNSNVSALNYTYTEINPASCWYSLNGGANSTPVSCGTNWTGLTSNEGSNTWIVYINDSAGNQNSSSVTFFKDTINSVISYGTGTLANGTTTKKDWIYVNVSVDEINEDTITFLLYNISGEFNSTSYTDSTRTINWTGLPDGIYYYNVTVNDTLNNKNSTETRTIIINTTLEITLIAPMNNSGDNDGNVSFVYTIDGTGDISNCSLIFSNSVNQTNLSQITKAENLNFNLTNLPSGKYNWSVNCSLTNNSVAYSESRIFSVILTTYLSGATTNFSNLNVTNITNLILEAPTYGKVNFSEIINLENGTDIGDNVNVSLNRIYVNSTAIPELNKTARLSFYGLSFTDPRPLKDGVVCSSCTEVSYSGGVFVYDVTGFSIYSSEETPVAPATTTAPSGGSGGSYTSPVNFKVTPDTFTRTIVLNRIESGYIEIHNIDGEAVLNFNVETIGNIISFENSSVKLGTGETKRIIFKITPPKETGIYTGKIIVTLGAERKEIPVVINVRTEKSLFDITLSISDSMKTLNPGENLKMQVNLLQMGVKENMDVELNYIIKDFDGKVYLTESETIAVFKQKEFTKEFDTNEFSTGDYVIGVELIYPGGIAVASSQFAIKEKTEIESRGLVIIILVSILVFVSSIIFLIMKRYKRIKNYIKGIRKK